MSCTRWPGSATFGSRRWRRALRVLSARGREILYVLGDGLTKAAIATRLHLSRRIVEHHVSTVLAELGVRSRAAAVAHTVR
jgi:DNA-binding NarL/FixJ family response regulator